MIIALDYDDTFTADKSLWSVFVEAAKDRGHFIQFVTFRNEDWPNIDIEEDAKNLNIRITYTNGRQKKHVFPEADIWIDDHPELCASYTDMLNMARGCEVNRDFE